MNRTRIEHSAGGVVIRTVAGAHHVLVIRDPYDNWGLPKGHLERGESAAAAALREVHEETGLAGVELGPELGSIDWYFRAEGHAVHKFCTFFLMRSEVGEPVPQRSEGISACLWVPLDDALRKIAYDNTREMIARAAVHLADARVDGP